MSCCFPYYTTSSCSCSCSGRISILSTPTSSTGHKKARGGSWLFITHDFADKDAVLDALFRVDDADASAQQCDVVFRFEPLIITTIVSLAIAAGVRESGITSVGKRVIVGIRCSIRMEYVEFLVGVANQKMEANRKRTDGFFQALLGNGFGGLGVAEMKDCAEINEVADSINGGVEQTQLEKTAIDGRLGASDCLPIAPMTIDGEPVERLFLWGHTHTACTMDDQMKVLVYGGFGGMGRHARRNDCLLLDPLGGALDVVKVENSPPSRLGHTASMVGKHMFVIGGRADPVNILNDVWVLDTPCFPVALRDIFFQIFRFYVDWFLADNRSLYAAVVGSKIYKYGGLNNDTVFSSFHMLDTINLKWSEIPRSTDWPAARHSHAMVATEFQLFIFGGCGTDKVLGELFSFDVRTHRWQKEQINGKVPRARFSHLMFVYKHFIGIMGGFPVNKACKEIALADLKLRAWKLIPLNSAGKDLLVRSTSNVVDDSLVIAGGGAACYAFGTKFSEPLTINLLPIISATGAISRNEKAQNCDVEKTYVSRSSDVPSNDSAEAVPQSHESSIESETSISHSFVLFERDFAKVGKDLLKKHGWLDLTRKAYSREDGKHICFPKTAPLSSDPLPTLCKLGATIIMNDAGEFRKPSHPPVKIMREAVASLLKRQDMPEDLLEELPARWERLGDIVVLPESSFKNKMWDSLGNEL
uniref:tRNA(Phe) 7-[(3-amino-3-carboxypropyl)-4-demethylwyosine(37)-N(4)]-methyltransferase n=1 Tax=Kalanchoe fedtschenkoi TaxID=63787 RepID=A0A7N0UHU0_KALFE